MNITLRLLLGYFLIVGLASWFVLNVFTQEVKPGVRQTMEETLVDTAQLLAELASDDMQSAQSAGTNINHGQFPQAFKRYQQHLPHANIWGLKKESADLGVYITDTRGIVIYDSTGKAIGKDYSRWNDVYRTLRGSYGARSTLAIPGDERSSVMHIAAPVKDKNGQLIGVLTVAKPTANVQPFIDRSSSRIQLAGWWLMGGALFIGVLFTWWLTRSINLLRRYAREVSAGRKAELPKLGSGELGELGRALAEMREKLDGREYVENYVHHLTHEMKSPLTAIIGSAELLAENPPDAERTLFTANIHQQSLRLKEMIDKLLALAMLERCSGLEQNVSVPLNELAKATVADHAISMQQRNIQCHNLIPVDASVTGDPFLLRQALSNLLDNAIEFSPNSGQITLALKSSEEKQTIIIQDEGTGIPDYAMPRIFERFYSLPRPSTQNKSTGLGLPFVYEVALLHHGSITLSNRPEGGVEARLTIQA